MPKLKLTQSAIARLPAPTADGRQRVFWDAALPGFGVACSGRTARKHFIAQRDLPSGLSRRVSIASVQELSLQQARQQAAELLVRMRKEDPKRRVTSRTLQQTLDRYLKVRRDLAVSTVKTYRYLVETHLADWLPRQLVSFTRGEINDRHSKLAEAIGARTADATLRVVSILWNYAADLDESLPANPVRVRWSQQKRRTRLVRADDLPTYWKALQQLDSDTGRDYLTLLLFTGLRRREAAALRWSEVDLAAGLIRLSPDRNKARREFVLPLSRQVKALLMRRHNIGGTFVFPAPGKHGWLQEPKKMTSRIAKATGIHASPHDLRRTYATNAASANVDAFALKGLLNHSTSDDVTAGYVVLSEQTLRRAAQKVSDRLTALCKV